MLAQKEKELADKRQQIIDDTEALRVFSSEKNLEVPCLGFPEASLKFEIFHGENGTKNRMEVSGVTTFPRAFKLSHTFEFDYRMV